MHTDSRGQRVPKRQYLDIGKVDVMSQRSAESIEFVRINGEAVRVTSWTELDATTFRLVAIVRGSGDARALTDLVANPEVTVEVPDQPVRTMAIVNVDRRESGEPPAIISRFAVDFSVGDTPIAAPIRSLEERVAQLETDLVELRKVVQALANAPR